jgi:hypothetical protein
MSYVLEHTDALADVRAAGQAVTFTLASPGTHNDADDTFTPTSPVEVSGAALEVTPGGQEADRYKALTLNHEEHRLLLFAADTYGDEPAKGSTVPWRGATYTVQGLLGGVAPDGVPILSRVVIVR